MSVRQFSLLHGPVGAEGGAAASTLFITESVSSSQQSEESQRIQGPEESPEIGAIDDGPFEVQPEESVRCKTLLPFHFLEIFLHPVGIGHQRDHCPAFLFMLRGLGKCLPEVFFRNGFYVESMAAYGGEDIRHGDRVVVVNMEDTEAARPQHCSTMPSWLYRQRIRFHHKKRLPLCLFLRECRPRHWSLSKRPLPHQAACPSRKIVPASDFQYCLCRPGCSPFIFL